MPAAPYSGAVLPDYDLGRNLAIFVWTLTAASGIFLGLRLFAVYWVLNRVRATDYVMTAAWLFMVAAGALTTRGVHWGLGRHIYYLTPTQIQHSIEYVILMDAPVIVAATLGRISFCLFLINTVGAEKSVRRLLWVAIVLQILVNATHVIAFYCSCGLKINALWDLSIHAKCLSYSSMSDYLYFLGAWNAFTDLFLTVLPAYLLKDLNVERRKKFIIMVLLCISGLAFIASLIKSVMTKELGNDDVTYSYGKLQFWVTGEGYVIIIVASTPLLNSLVRWGKQKSTDQSYGSSTYYNSSNQVTVKQSWAVGHDEEQEYGGDTRFEE